MQNITASVSILIVEEMIFVELHTVLARIPEKVEKEIKIRLVINTLMISKLITFIVCN